MERKRKLIVAGGIMFLGLALALMFRKHDGGQLARGDTEPALPLQGAVEKIDYVAAPGEKPVEIPEPVVTAAAKSAPAPVPAPLPAIERPHSAATPPAIAEKYDRQLFALADMRPIGDSPIAQEVSHDPPQPSSKPLRNHRVNDGDTLETIARRYLGDATRWGEIFEANRTRLADPFQLPIGATLTIPPRENEQVEWPSIQADRSPQMSIMAPIPRRAGGSP
ncbi:MAG: LysM peptidoglycan-binding domain-containing protein [Planctomycetales bacterium]|nr:LysM peptidoglycan-binding domain-containing protein [Planctomycetales bacterium]